MSEKRKLLEVIDLETHITTSRGIIKAVDRVSLTISSGRTLGVVGETGSGKSMTAFSILKLFPSKAIRIVGGQVCYRYSNDKVVDIVNLSAEDSRLRKIRGREISLVFQDSLSSLNPVYSIGYQIVENIINNKQVSKKEAYGIALDLLIKVGLSAPEKRIRQYPHELSGGMRQRALIALALSTEPKILIADEPTTALDVTIQAQILELVKEIQQSYSMGMMLITHDMGVIAENSDDVAVMYLGSIVEYVDVFTLFSNPAHPYTCKLLDSIIRLGSKGKPIHPIYGSIPEPINLKPGCKFYDRCHRKMYMCENHDPPLVSLNDTHSVKCWLFEKGKEMQR